MKNDEIEIQDSVRQYLESKDLIVFDVVYTNEFNGALSITFIIKDDLTEFLESLNYKSLCDKSGFLITGNTVILSGMALFSFVYHENKS